MSWLTEFTSKAENFLNKIDQSAAHTLNESTIGETVQSNQHIGELNIPKEPLLYSKAQEPSKNTPPLTPINRNFETQTYHNPTPDAKVSGIKVKELKNDETSNLTRSSSSPSLKKQDDMLFQFLNSNNPVTTKSHVRNLSGPKTSTPRKPLPISSATPSSTEQTEERVAKDVVADPKPSSPEKIEVTNLPQKEEINPIPSTIEIQNNTQKKTENQIDERISNLEFENRLLKNEMQSLNVELSTTMKKLNEQQQETEKFKLRYENRRSQQNEDYERIQSQFESREADLNEALKAKDSQLAVLRVRIQEVDSELKEKTKALNEVQERNERIFKDHSDATGVQGEALDSLRNKLEVAQGELRQQQTENSSIKAELINLQTKLQSEQHQYAETIKQLQSRQNEGKDKSREMDLKVKNAEDIASVATKELKEYKDKAARILQAKEKLISSLRQGTESSEISPVLLSELEETKHERDMFRDEVQQMKYKTEQLRSEYLDLELLHNNESNDNEQRIESLQSSLQEEHQKRMHAEEDMRRYMQEIQFTREDLKKVKESLISSKQEHELEIKKLNYQLAAKAMQSVNSSQEELENRIRTLTDSLIHKQTVVETLGTEKNSLILQLERLEKQYKDVENSLTRRNRDHSTDIEDPGSGPRLQPMASIMPSQITQNKHWKRTVNDIDKFSIRLGVFLRRYPIARLMIIFYMFILHLWVTFVLLTYTPEMHGHDGPNRPNR